MIRKIVLGIFILAIILFLMPWINISCAGAPIISASGFDMITGAYNVPTDYIDSNPQSEIFAVLALIAAIVGLIACLIRHKIAFFTRVISGIAGIAFLIALKLKIDRDIFSQSEGILQVNYLLGYWLTIIAFVSAIVVSLLRKKHRSH